MRIDRWATTADAVLLAYLDARAIVEIELLDPFDSLTASETTGSSAGRG